MGLCDEFQSQDIDNRVQTANLSQDNRKLISVESQNRPKNFLPKKPIIKVAQAIACPNHEMQAAIADRLLDSL